MVSIARKFLTSEYSDEELAVICYLRECVSGIRNFVLITKGDVEYILFANSTSTKDHHTIANGVLKRLVKSGILVKQTTTYIAYSSVFDSDGSYILLEEGVLDRFINLPERRRWGIFHLYCLYLSNVSSRYHFKAGNRPISYFADELQLAEATIMRYTKTLEDMQLIYVSHSTYKEDCTTNAYGRYSDKDEIPKETKTNANFKRSVTQRYHRYCQDPTCIKDVEQLICDVEKYNKLQQPYVGKFTWAKLLDTSIFNLQN